MEQVAAGMQTLDVIDSHATNAGIELYRAGILAPLEDIPNINGYDEKFGPLRFRQYGIFDGKLYGLYQYNWDFPPEFACAMMFNTDMLNSFGLVYRMSIRKRADGRGMSMSRYSSALRMPQKTTVTIIISPLMLQICRNVTPSAICL